MGEKSVLITGGAGFIGRSLVELLKLNYKIVSTTRKSMDLLNSAKVQDYIIKGNFDIIIHTATYDAAPANSNKLTELVLENNLKMFFNISRCSPYFEKMIYFGSGAEFGRDNWGPKMKEAYFDVHIPLDPYGFSKYVMAKYTQNSRNIYNLRLFGLFGEFDDWRYRFIPNLCCHAILNLPIHVQQNALKDYIYINDVCEVVKWVIDNDPKNKIYNVCSSFVKDHWSIAKEIIDISGNKLSMNVRNKKINCEYSGDNTLLKSEMPNFRVTPLRTAMKKVYEWFLENKTLIKEEEFLF